MTSMVTASEMARKRWAGIGADERSALAKAAVKAREAKPTRSVICTLCKRKIRRKDAIVAAEYLSRGKPYRRYRCAKCARKTHHP